MHIAVNLRLYVQGKIGGLENYVRHVVAGIAEHQKRKKQPLTIFVRQTEIENVRDIAPDARILPIVPELFIWAVDTELDCDHYDLLFCPLLVLDPMLPKVPAAVMIPDLQHEFFPEFFDAKTLQWRRQTYPLSVLHANVIYTLSEHAKRTFVEKLRVDPAKIEVIYLDVDQEFTGPTTPEALATFQWFRLPQDYFFFPANFWPHKNHANLLRALQVLVQGRYPDLGLVLTGAPSTGIQEIKRQTAELGLENHVWLLGYQERHVIVELYRHARALAFVSRFEGFGIPILEAFHTGTPVITSTTCSCPEVAADAALLVDPLDPVAIAEAMTRILEGPELCQQLIKRGKVRAQQFSWQRAIDVTLASFERILAVPDRLARRATVQAYPAQASSGGLDA